MVKNNQETAFRGNYYCKSRVSALREMPIAGLTGLYKPSVAPWWHQSVRFQTKYSFISLIPMLTRITIAQKSCSDIHRLQ